MNYYVFIPLVAFIVNVYTGTFVYAQKKKSGINKAYLLYITSIQLWLVTEIALWVISKNKYIITLLKFQACCWITLGIYFLNFTSLLIKKRKNKIYNLYMYSIVGSVYIILSTNLFINGYNRYNWGVAEKPGILYIPLFIFMIVIPFVYSFFLIFKEIKHNGNEIIKNQLKLLLWGTIIALIIASSMDIVIPVFFNHGAYIRISSSVSVIQSCFIFIAITKYKFLSIRIEDAYMDLFNAINEGIILLDKYGVIIEMNAVAQKMLSFCCKNIEKPSINSFIEDYEFSKEYKNYETKIQCGNEERFILISQSSVQNSKVELGKILILNDITDSVLVKHEKESFRYLSITDALTGLYNHRYFYDYLRKEFSKGSKDIALLFCDIDRFKQVNDYYGHVIGDMILRETANIIKEEVNDSGLAFRYGGEEFIVILNEYSSQEAFDVAERIREKIKSNIVLQEENQGVPVTISIGVASYPPYVSNIEELIVKADKALYYSKQNGRNQSNIYNNEMDKLLESKKNEIAKKELLIDSVYSLAKAIDVKDSYTGMHSEMVAKYTLLLAEELCLSDFEKEELKIGALLHDCGKIGVPDNIINKQGKLSEEEFNIVKNHTMLGSEIASNIIKTQEIKACIRNHHERWDGKGYPDGLQQENIPRYARIVCIADAYHAMVSDRPYRKGLTKEEAINQLVINKGIQFDSQLVDVFIEAIKNGKDI